MLSFQIFLLIWWELLILHFCVCISDGNLTGTICLLLVFWKHPLQRLEKTAQWVVNTADRIREKVKMKSTRKSYTGKQLLFRPVNPYSLSVFVFSKTEHDVQSMWFVVKRPTSELMHFISIEDLGWRYGTWVT